VSKHADFQTSFCTWCTPAGNSTWSNEEFGLHCANCRTNTGCFMGKLVIIFSCLWLLALWDFGWEQCCLFGCCVALMLATTFDMSSLTHVICTICWLCDSSNSQMWCRNSNLPLQNGQLRFHCGQLVLIKAKGALCQKRRPFCALLTKLKWMWHLREVRPKISRRSPLSAEMNDASTWRIGAPVVQFVL